MGSRVFDDGCFLPEKTLATIGDDCTLNAGSVIQCHSQEDGAFKSDYTTIGSGCTVGVGALVHYGVTMGDGAVLAPDSFLMKGEQVPRHGHWGGNPAGDLRDRAADLGIRQLSRTTYIPRRALLTGTRIPVQSPVGEYPVLAWDDVPESRSRHRSNATYVPKRAMVSAGRSET